MKFLCVACNKAMELRRTLTPEEGSLTVVFCCPACGRETAMLTNPMETQMVRSLGVKIGGGAAAVEPMEMVRTFLTQGGGEARAADLPPPPASSLLPTPAAGSGSKCPFSGVVADAFLAEGWSLDVSSEVQQLEGLPLYVYVDEGESVTKPCAEVLLSDPAVAVLRDAGLVPLVSERDMDRVALPCLQSLALPRAPISWR